MKKKILQSVIMIMLLISADFGVIKPSVAATHSSDRLSISWPGAGADHNISFQLTNDLAPGARIVITPQDGHFWIMDNFNEQDVDLAVAAAPEGPFIDREIASSASFFEDGVSAVSSTTSGHIAIELSSGFGISAGSYLQIALGLNADYQASGIRQIVNPQLSGSYEMGLEIFAPGGEFIERAYLMVSIIEPVTMGNFVDYRKFSGSPLGWLGYNTSETIMSIMTNYRAHCRYDIASNTPWAEMDEEFDYSTSTGDYYHTVLIGGLANGQQYDVYIKCRPDTGGFSGDEVTQCIYNSASTTPWFDEEGNPVVTLDCDEYWLHFGVTGIEGADGDSEGGGNPNDPGEGEGSSSGNKPGTGGGGSGSGGGDGGGRGNEDGRGVGEYLPYPPPLGDPGVILSGWAYPGVDVTILQDGDTIGLAKAGLKAEFGAFLENTKQGVYTFSLWAQDPNAVQGLTYSTTFWIDDGTQTTVSDIIIPPTISLNATEAKDGQAIEVRGYSVPDKEVEIWAYPGSLPASDKTAVILKAVPDVFGRYAAYLDTSGLSSGNYKVKVRTLITGVGQSEWSKLADLAVGAVAEPVSECSGADLNQDKRVNLTDFSILLYHWGTANACADQNKNGSVDLTDFSIMMYYWTG